MKAVHCTQSGSAPASQGPEMPINPTPHIIPRKPPPCGAQAVAFYQIIEQFWQLVPPLPEIRNWKEHGRGSLGRMDMLRTYLCIIFNQM